MKDYKYPLSSLLEVKQYMNCCQQETPPLVLVGLRTDLKGWQFPQGGIDQNESPIEALKREMHEEIGVSSFCIVAQLDTPLSYNFEEKDRAESAFLANYIGQEQHWFLCQLEQGTEPDLANAADHEFVQLKWVTPQEAFQNIVSFKKAVYKRGLEALSLL